MVNDLFFINHYQFIIYQSPLNHPMWDRLGTVEGGQDSFGGHPGHGGPGFDRGTAQVRRQHHAGVVQQAGMHRRLLFEHV